LLAGALGLDGMARGEDEFKRVSGENSTT